jgi:RNA-directed DNA polymerase
LLAVSEKELIYILYRGGKVYAEFDTPKRAGGVRHIAAPVGSIKILQRRLNQVLRAVYQPKASVHGFAVERSIVTNADRHVAKNVIF